MNRLLAFLCSLENNKIHYTLEHHGGAAIVVLIAVPGQRWEVEFLADDHVEIEGFLSCGAVVSDVTLLESLIRDYGDPLTARQTAENQAASTSIGVEAPDLHPISR
jgi:hypothetical protein